MTNRRFSRLDRVNRLVLQVIADELELIDDDRTAMAALTGVAVEGDLARAVVWFDSLADPAEVVAALAVHRVRLQAAIARQLKLKRTPELVFEPDPAIATGSRVEEILRTLHESPGPHPGEPAAEDGSP